MSISPKCANCGKELDDFGAILLSPPDNENNVQKLHLCKGCYQKIALELKPKAD